MAKFKLYIDVSIYIYNPLYVNVVYKLKANVNKPGSTVVRRQTIAFKHKSHY